MIVRSGASVLEGVEDFFKAFNKLQTQTDNYALWKMQCPVLESDGIVQQGK